VPIDDLGHAHAIRRRKEKIAMKVGFIGLGRMGQGMARSLLKAGFEVTVWDRTRSHAEALREYGAMVADTPAGAATDEAVITMLADDHAVEEIVLGGGRVIRTMREDAVHISMSTITVASSEELTQARRTAGQRFVAAPVFGRPEAAAAAQLYIVAAGAPEPVDRCRPRFDAMGQKTFVLGAFPPAANLVKLGGNFLIASLIECLGEAIALMRKADVPAQRFVEILTESLFAAPVYKTYGQLILEEKYEPAGFKMPLALKDIRSVLAAAEAKAVPMPVASLIHDHFLTEVARGNNNLDWSALARLAAENAGLEPSVFKAAAPPRFTPGQD
jgi:3-hydroxyisobutyrate dehydrogenase-like beta-hydroxyacid dehydrogenase